MAETGRLANTVVVIGAGRSGTTMLREALASHPDLAACTYEMNYLWRYGNAHLAHDMLVPEKHLTPAIAAHIRRELDKIRAEIGKPRLVEKTVANVMRLRYVDAVLPDARFIHVIRDGRAVTASAMQRWRSKPSGGYLAAKARTIPLRDVLPMAWRYASNRIRGMLRGRNHSLSWGPRWPGFDDDVREMSLPQICARQWVESVRAAQMQRRALPRARYAEVRYEDIVHDPVGELTRLAIFVDIDPEAETFQQHIREQIRDSSLDRWKRSLVDGDLKQAMEQLSPLLNELGYT